MSRLDVHPMPGRAGHGYVIDVQADLLEHLKTRIVVPLIPEKDAPPRIKDLNPIFEVAGAPHVMVTQAIATVPTRELRQVTMSLNKHHDDITRALDILLTGY